ncbi:MAG: superoxide dismutase [Nakamurella sp.]
MRRIVVTTLVVGALALTGGGVVAADPGGAGQQTGDERFPAVIALPTGFRPEGISIGKGTTFYVGSVANGAIYRGDVRTGQGTVLVPGVLGAAAIGTEVDSRNQLWVAGGPTGLGRVYDAKSGALLAEYPLVDPARTPTFVNDVVVTRRAAYFTDSLNKVLYVVPIGHGGRPAEMAATLNLWGDLTIAAGNNLNGLEATNDGRTLFAVQSNKGLLFTIDPLNGRTRQINLGGTSLANGDGLLLQRSTTLYVVQNRLNQIAVIKLDRSYRSGRLLDTITNDSFAVPTTIAPFGRYLYAVNARFGVNDPDTAEYSVVRVESR